MKCVLALSWKFQDVRFCTASIKYVCMFLHVHILHLRHVRLESHISIKTNKNLINILVTFFSLSLSFFYVKRQIPILTVK